VIAPSFTEESLRFLSGKKNLRVLTFPQSSIEPQKFSYKSISGGALRQETDTFAEIEWNFLKNKPSTELLQSMKFGEKVAGYLKSNSIAIVYKGQTIGLGMGQVNRVDAVEQALHRMQNFSTQHKIDLNEVILVSDAFFPFPDSIDLIAQNGIQWIVQPGGSVKDAQVAEAAKKQNINMVLTQTRHFRH
jgi:phosphoribosylaminoimidazolecarboxamide formyltransferase / IMP cyclohydrolase